MKKIYLLSVVILCCNVLSKAQIFVDPSGNDLNNGLSIGTAKLTIDAAILVASSGDVINISAGTYSGCTVNKSVTLSGAGIGSTVISGSGSGVGIIIIANNITIQNLSITNFISGIVHGISTTNISISNVSSSGNTTYGYYSNQNIDGLTINNCIFNNNSPNNGRGLMLQSATNYYNITITNSTFNNNGLVGLDVNGNTAINNITIQGNTVNNNGDAGISILAGPSTPSTSTLIVRNNSITMQANQRFGMEIKDVVANGATSGAGSAVIDDNYIIQSAVGTNSRDFAGIAVIRRSVSVSTTEPNGIIITKNTVLNIREGDGTCGTCAGNIGNGFGIVAGGTNHQITNNRVEGCQIGIQLQGGNINAGTTGDSPSVTGNANTLYFDRDNSSSCNGSIVRYNSILGYTTKAIRNVQNSGFSPTIVDYTGNWLGATTFTLTDIESNLVSDPAIATFTSVLNSNAAFNPWLAVDPDDLTGTSSGQRGVQISGSKTYRITATETTTGLGVIQQGILIGNTAFIDILDIRSGSYNVGTMISISKGITLLGDGGYPAGTRPILTMTADISSVLQVAAQNITIDNLYIKLDGTATGSFPRKHGIFVANHTTSLAYNNLIIQNNFIENTHTTAGLDFNAYGIRLAQDVGFGIGNNNVTITNNSIFSTGTNAFFGRGIRSIGNYGTISNNTFTSFYGIQNANINAGNLNITNNTFNVVGDVAIELNVPQQNGGLHTISNNTFTTSASALLNPTAIIEIKDNGNLGGVTSNISIDNNTFTDVINIGVFCGHSSNISITNNTCNPKSTSTTYNPIYINTKHRTSGGTPNVKCDNITIKGNTLNANALSGTTGIIFGNHQSGVNPAFTNITVGGTGASEANNFPGGLTTFISLDPNAGASTSLTIWSGSASTTMIPVAEYFDASNNNFDAGAGLQLPSVMSNLTLFSLENKISHRIDYGSLGFVTAKGNNVYLTKESFLSGFTTAPRIQRATNAPTTDGFTINIEQFIYSDDVSSIPVVAYNMNFQPVFNGGSTFVQTPNLTMNGTSKTLTLLGDLYIDNQVIFTDGNISTGSNKLIFTSSAVDPAINPATNGEKASSRIIGQAQTTRPVNTGALTFLGIDIPAGSDLGTVALLRTTDAAAIITVNTYTSIACNWVVTPTINASRNGVTFNWLPILNNSKDPNFLSVWRSETGSNPWFKQTADFTAPTTSPLMSTIAVSPSQFSTWTIADISNPLPLEEIRLQAILQGGLPLLFWKTTQRNIDYFEIERSLDSINFNAIQKINANNTASYSHKDEEILKGTIYYRLKVFYKNDQNTYSNTVSIAINYTQLYNDQVFPNPNNGSFYLKTKLSTSAQAMVFNSWGQLIGNYTIQDGLNNFDFTQYPNGMYHLLMKGENKTSSYKIIIQK